jgi:hypothetical protein
VGSLRWQRQLRPLICSGAIADGSAVGHSRPQKTPEFADNLPPGKNVGMLTTQQTSTGNIPVQ